MLGAPGDRCVGVPSTGAHHSPGSSRLFQCDDGGDLCLLCSWRNPQQLHLGPEHRYTTQPSKIKTYCTPEHPAKKILYLNLKSIGKNKFRPQNLPKHLEKTVRADFWSCTKLYFCNLILCIQICCSHIFSCRLKKA